MLLVLIKLKKVKTQKMHENIYPKTLKKETKIKNISIYISAL
jgi:hypothetical protein